MLAGQRLGSVMRLTEQPHSVRSLSHDRRTEHTLFPGPRAVRDFQVPGIFSVSRADIVVEVFDVGSTGD